MAPFYSESAQHTSRSGREGEHQDRPPVREEANKLLTGHPRPSANAADIDVDEIGAWIEADAAVLQAHCCLPHARGVNVGKADVHSPPEHMLAVLGDGARAAPKGLVGLR